MLRTRCIVHLATAALLLAAATPARAQVVRGTVADAAGSAVRAVSVHARTAAGATAASATSDSLGMFELRLPAPGTYLLVATRVGYDTAAPTEVQLRAAEELQVRILVDIDALRLAPIDVTARRRVPIGRAAVYRRIELMRQQGIGRAATRADIEQMRPPTTARLLAQMAPRIQLLDTRDANVNTVLLRDAAGYCAPAIFIDGMRMNTRPVNVNYLIDPHRIEAVELYTGAAQIPVGFHDPQGCGSVLIWSRTDAGGETVREHSLKRVAVAGLLVAGALLLMR